MEKSGLPGKDWKIKSSLEWFRGNLAVVSKRKSTRQAVIGKKHNGGKRILH